MSKAVERRNQEFHRVTQLRKEKNAATRERTRMLDELLMENVDLEVVQKVTGAYMSIVIRHKIKLLEKQLREEEIKEGKTPEQIYKELGI